MALKVWDSFISVKKSLFLNTSTVANKKEIIGQAQKMFRESLEWEKQQKLHLPQGVPGERNTAIKRLFNTEITERDTILPLKWKSYKQTAR